MLYAKEIEKITFQDVIEFCNQQYRENINLDYKQELNSSVAKTIAIRVPQSNLTPHAIKNNTKVYIRTDTSNEPEELASVDRILWLIDRRKKSEMLKNGFYERAEARFNTLCKREGVIIERTDAIFSICPLYPFEALIDYKKITSRYS